jgi:phage terminase small subunit
MLAMQQRGRTSAAALATVPIDGRSPLLRPPATLSDRERSIWVHVVTAVRPEHFKLGDEALLTRYCETVVLCDLTGKRLAADIAEGRPSPHLSVQERLLKMLVVLCRQLRLSPLARTPHKDGHPPALDLHSNGHAHVSAYEQMRLSNDPQ